MSDTIFNDDNGVSEGATVSAVDAEELAEIFGEDFDYSIDFDTLSPPDEKLPARIKSVEYVRENKRGERSRQLIISVNLDTEEWPAYAKYHKAPFRDFLWLGVDKIEVMGARRVANFLEAVTGEKIHGKIDWLKYGLQKVTVEGSERYFLSGLEDLPVGVQLETKADKSGTMRQGIKTYVSAEGLRPLAATEFTDDI